MINSRKAIWADNLRCSHVLKLPQAALVFSVYVGVWLWQQRFILCIVSVHEDPHIDLSLSLEHLVFQPHIKKNCWKKLLISKF